MEGLGIKEGEFGENVAGQENVGTDQVEEAELLSYEPCLLAMKTLNNVIITLRGRFWMKR